jgi:hypothetical protein
VFCLLLLYFPDGRLPSRSWRPVTWLAIAVGVAETVMAALRPGDDETPGIPNPLGASVPDAEAVRSVAYFWLCDNEGPPGGDRTPSKDESGMFRPLNTLS